MKSIMLVPDKSGPSHASSPTAPKIHVMHPSAKVDETMLKTSVAVPFRNTPYLVEVAVTQVWTGMKTASEADTWWGIEFYGQGWDEAVNTIKPDERRKNWGKGFEAVWPGGGAWESRFMEFIEHVLAIQSAVEDVDFGPASGQKQ